MICVFEHVHVIARDGKIAARQQWADPAALARHIDAALSTKTSVATE